MPAGCYHHSCLTLTASSRGQSYSCGSHSPKQNFRGNGCGLAIQLMQGNELSG